MNTLFSILIVGITLATVLVGGAFLLNEALDDFPRLRKIFSRLTAGPDLRLPPEIRGLTVDQLVALYSYEELVAIGLGVTGRELTTYYSLYTGDVPDTLRVAIVQRLALDNLEKQRESTDE